MVFPTSLQGFAVLDVPALRADQIATGQTGTLYGGVVQREAVAGIDLPHPIGCQIGEVLEPCAAALEFVQPVLQRLDVIVRGWDWCATICHVRSTLGRRFARDRQIPNPWSH